MKKIATLIVLTIAFSACTKSSNNGSSSNNNNSNITSTWTISTQPSNSYDGTYSDTVYTQGWNYIDTSNFYTNSWNVSGINSSLNLIFLHKPNANKLYKVMNIIDSYNLYGGQLIPNDDSTVSISAVASAENQSSNNPNYYVSVGYYANGGGYLQVNESTNGKIVTMTFKNVSFTAIQETGSNKTGTWQSTISGTLSGNNY